MVKIFTMDGRKALVLGGTGLTGSLLVQELLENPAYEKVTCYVRQFSGRTHPKLVEQVVKLDSYQGLCEADDVFCCLGATIKTVKTREAFQLVDLDAPLHLAKLQLAAGSQRFLVMSAAGADENSSVFYNRVKGKLEKGLKELGYPLLVIFQPSFILGKRKEVRPLERLGIQVAKWLSPILISRFKKYLPVQAHAIAKAMVHYALNSRNGVYTIPSDRIKAWEQPPTKPDQGN